MKIELVMLENELQKALIAVMKKNKVQKDELIFHMFHIAGCYIAKAHGELNLLTLTASIKAEARQFRSKEYFK